MEVLLAKGRRNVKGNQMSAESNLESPLPIPRFSFAVSHSYDVYRFCGIEIDN